ncbi:DUF5677 domain-containing protein [Cupriavidus basilensis]|uniref:DUF5677 domain-containing protein n=1 Tax=Cupriavidus basilensis TaxID=68895 RepID=UPI0039F6DC74
MSPTDTIKTRGFLSPQIETFQAEYRAELKDTFKAVEASSDAATKLLFEAQGLANLGGHELLAFAFWCRCLAACQGTIILAERGMVPEAQILLRGAFEFLFFALAAIEDPCVFDSLDKGHGYATAEQARAMLKEGAPSGKLTPEQVATLEAFVQQADPGAKALTVFAAAQKAGLSYHHAAVYRGLSFIAAHPTMAATDALFEQRSCGQTQMVFGPSSKGLAFTLGLVDTCLTSGAPRIERLLADRAQADAPHCASKG